MAKLGSSSCRPLLQGMMLLALLLLASIQAGPVMAGDEQVVADLGEKLRDLVVNKAPEKALTELRKKKGWEGFSNGGKTGIKAHKYLCKAQGWMDKQNPGGANFVNAIANALGRGGDLLSRSFSFPTFSYYVTSEGTGNSNSVFVCWSSQPQVPAAGTGATTTLVRSRYPNDGRYYVQMTGIRVVGLGQELVELTPTELNLTPYLSTTHRYTYLESSLYGRLREAVIRQTNVLNPEAPPSPITAADKLCYAAAALSVKPRLPVPGIAILLASNNAMQTMELGGAVDTVWYRESSMICLGILPTMEEPVLGSMIQSGRRMTIDLTAAGGLGTLTF